MRSLTSYRLENGTFHLVFTEPGFHLLVHPYLCARHRPIYLFAAPAPRHLAKRSPICKRSASPCIIAKTLKKKKLFKKFLIKSPKIAKKLVKFGVPAAALGAASNAPALLAPLAELGVIGAVGGATGGLGATFGPQIAQQLSSTFG